jgi:hypothetical protein
MEVKFERDTKKASKAAVAIAATYGLCRVSKGTKFPQFVTANTIALIVIIAYSMTLTRSPKNPPKQA